MLVVFRDRFLALHSFSRIQKQSFARKSINRSILSHSYHKSVSLLFQTPRPLPRLITITQFLKAKPHCSGNFPIHSQVV